MHTKIVTRVKAQQELHTHGFLQRQLQTSDFQDLV